MKERNQTVSERSISSCNVCNRDSIFVQTGHTQWSCPSITNFKIALDFMYLFAEARNVESGIAGKTSSRRGDNPFRDEEVKTMRVLSTGSQRKFDSNCPQIWLSISSLNLFLGLLKRKEIRKKSK